MNKMSITIEIDLDNVEQVEAAKQMMDVLSGNEDPKPKTKVTKKEEPDEEESEEEGTDITVEELRDLTKEKAGKHRDAIKEKIQKLGGTAVSDLPKKNYAAYQAFLEKLK